MRDPALVLRSKYQLVHVPNRGKVNRWASETKSLIEKGYPSEQAGMEAAQKVFRYEYKEHNVFNETPAEEILHLL